MLKVKMKNKILHITMKLNIGGAETHILEVVKELSKKYDVIVASSGGTYVDELRRNNIVHYNVPFNSKNPLKVIKSLYLLKSIIEKEKIDIVHSHARIPSFVAGLVSKITKTTFVTTTHGHFKVTPLLRAFTFWGEHSIAVSSDLKDYLIKEYGFDSHNVSLTVNGIDTSIFKPKSVDKTQIVHVSRLDSETSLVAEMLTNNAKTIYEMTGYTIKIVGDGTNLPSLIEKARNLKYLDTYIFFVGASDKVSMELENAAVFIGVSRSLLEAMCFNIPVILAGDVGFAGMIKKDASHQYMDTNFSGRGLEKTNEYALLKAINTSMNYVNTATWSYQFIEENYSLKAMCRPYEVLYSDILSRAKSYIISGYYGYKNSGDDSLLASVVKTIYEVNPKNQIVILTKKNSTYHFDNVKYIDRFSLLSILSNIKKTDVLVMGGGSLIQDKTSSRSLYYYLLVIRIAALYRKKIYMYANGFGPINKRINQKITRKVLDRVSVITFRDKHSYHFIKTIGVTRPHMLVTADSVYSVNRIQTKNTTAKNRAVFIIRNWEGADVFIRELALFADYLAEEKKYEIVFLPLKLPDDLNISKNISSLMKQPYKIVELGNENDLIAYLSTSKFSVSMRFHGVVYSSIASVLSIGLNYDKKVASICEILQLPCLNIDDIKVGNLISEFSYLETNSKILSQHMNKGVQELKERSNINKEILYKI